MNVVMLWQKWVIAYIHDSSHEASHHIITIHKMPLGKKAFENIMGKGENAVNHFISVIIHPAPGSFHDLRTGGCLFEPPPCPN